MRLSASRPSWNQENRRKYHEVSRKDYEKMQKYTKQNNGKYVATVWDGTYTPTGKKHRKYLYSTKSSKDLEKKVKAYEEAVKSRNAIQKGILRSWSMQNSGLKYISPLHPSIRKLCTQT